MQATNHKTFDHEVLRLISYGCLSVVALFGAILFAYEFNDALALIDGVLVDFLSIPAHAMAWLIAVGVVLCAIIAVHWSLRLGYRSSIRFGRIAQYCYFGVMLLGLIAYGWTGWSPHAMNTVLRAASGVVSVFAIVVLIRCALWCGGMRAKDSSDKRRGLSPYTNPEDSFSGKEAEKFKLRPRGYKVRDSNGALIWLVAEGHFSVIDVETAVENFASMQSLKYYIENTIAGALRVPFANQVLPVADSVMAEITTSVNVLLRNVLAEKGVSVIGPLRFTVVGDGVELSEEPVSA